MKDFGYDIADFYSIDPIFGTWEDFEELYRAIKDAGLRLLMDLIPNHTSNEHEWFIKSVAGEDPYTDYYVWKPSKGLDANGSQIPPNNWVSTDILQCYLAYSSSKICSVSFYSARGSCLASNRY